MINKLIMSHRLFRYIVGSWIYEESMAVSQALEQGVRNRPTNGLQSF